MLPHLSSFVRSLPSLPTECQPCPSKPFLRPQHHYLFPETRVLLSWHTYSSPLNAAGRTGTSWFRTALADAASTHLGILEGQEAEEWEPPGVSGVNLHPLPEILILAMGVLTGLGGEAAMR